MSDDREAPAHSVDGVEFGVYSAEEIKAISVKKLTNSQVFDSLMHPTFGGLYDPALGPQERDDVCGTCGLTSMFCPGHMGYLTLPLVAYNPIFFRNLIQILRGSCFSCRRLLLTTSESTLLRCQFSLLARGLACEAEELRQLFSSWASPGAGIGGEDAVSERLQEHTDGVITALPSDHEVNTSAVKHVTESKQLILKHFLRGDFFKKRCPHCKTKRQDIRSEHSTKIFFAAKTTAAEQQAMAAKIRAAKKRMEKLKQMANNETPEVMEEEVTEVTTFDPKTLSAGQQQYLTPESIHKHLEEVWRSDSALLASVMGVFGHHGNQGGHGNQGSHANKHINDLFFLKVMPVPPSRFRPVSMMNNRLYENAQTSNLNKVLQASGNIREILGEMRLADKGEATDKNESLLSIPGSTLTEKLQSAWLSLQVAVNHAMDSSLDKLSKDNLPGVRQLLEKKEGLFRKHMMGKRVNFAARSVIAPDPYLSTNEIGIPMVFAQRLTYPQPVTPWNFTEMKQLVLNGANVYPGATHVEYENGNKVSLHSRNETQREAIAKQLLTPEVGGRPGTGCKKVYRHLKNGDVLLLNRQPTLHRPSIQAHKARVLPGQKTLRMHYANCKAYNADFDGDEMNAHFPQNELSRSEAYHLMGTDYNYLVPKDGTPLAGLIQDHMISGVKLTMRGRHFCRHDYHQLVYSALSNNNKKLALLPPCMLKPRQLWSGKQVLSTVLLNLIPEGKAPLNLDGKAKIAPKNFVGHPTRLWRAGGSPFVDDEMGESEVVIRQGELLVGVLDKGHYGNTPYGLVHCCYELYGPIISGRLLTALTRLFMAHLQWRGFTLGVEDILVTAEGNRKRRRVNRQAPKRGRVASAAAVGIDDADDIDDATLTRKLEEAQFAKDDGGMKDLDLQMKSCTDGLSNNVVRSIMPCGLLKRFPDNNLQLMVQSGAKGSTVNCMQISCLLGQIELEGRRPPLMLSGRALPSFLAYDTSPRAGGYVDGRFLTGIRPQEYFFHCMAGREGLIDTAVKTSRSGYLQRCLIKHLEGLVVGYDMSVRDSDGSIVQFQYGEDGVDILRSQFLSPRQFPFLAHNQAALRSDERIAEVTGRLGTGRVELPASAMISEDADVHKATKVLAKRRKKWEKVQQGPSRPRLSPFLNWCERHAADVLERKDTGRQGGQDGRSPRARALCDAWSDCQGQDQRTELERKLQFITVPPDPIQTLLRCDRHFGIVSERFSDIVKKYTKNDPDNIIISAKERSASDARRITSQHLTNLLHLKYMQSLVQPGENVGLIAAQSIGEPSTQMTLNTFHFAGRGEMNVTLGIPRLREILMVASKTLKTPSMTIPILDTGHARKRSKVLQQKFTRVFLSQVLEDVDVTEYLSIKKGGRRCRVYKLRFSFLPYEMYKSEYYLTPARILAYMEKHFFVRLGAKIKRRMEDLKGSSLLKSAKLRQSRKGDADEEDASAAVAKDEADNDIVDDDLNDDDATATKLRQRQDEEREYDGEEEERGEVEEEEDINEEEELAALVDGLDSGVDSDDEHDTTTTARVKKLKNKVKVKEVDLQRVKLVMSQLSVATDYVYDTEQELWCEITLAYPLSNKKLDMSAVVSAESKVAIVTQTKGITRCFMSQSKKQEDEGTTYLTTEGINIGELYNYQDILDLKKLYTNDIHAMAEKYGIEAACRVLIKEIRDVFGAYGITVDYRHLSLIADYLTFQGVYKSFSRGGITGNASPLQKMTFETSMEFLKTATLMGATDDLKSPSSRIVIGRLVHGGTGAFDLLQPL